MIRRRIHNNNIAFLDRLEGLESLADLRKELQFQLDDLLYNYTEKEWLEHTVFICKDRFRESGKEILNETVKWCDNQLKNSVEPTKDQQVTEYKPKEVKIAYFCLEQRITEDNYLEILEKYTTSKSKKILQKPFVKSNQLTSSTGDKTANTKHLKSLINAERLLKSKRVVTSGIKLKEALKSIKRIISTFESNSRSEHE